MTPIRTLVVGDDAPGGGGWCYARALERAGHQVTHQSDWVGLERYRTRPFWRAYRRVTAGVREADRRRHATALHAAAAVIKPHVVLVLGGLNTAGEDVRRYQQLGAWVANISHDDFFSRYQLNTSRPQREAIPAYDQILTTREVNVAEVRPRNPRVEFFPFAYEPSIHRPVPVPPDETDRWGVDVVFVGTYAAQRAGLLERLVAAVPARYAVHGGSWHKLGRSSPLRPFVRSGPVLFDEQAKALGGAKIALGFLRKENRDDYTQRTFEIPACGGLLLAERTDRHRALYREGEEAEFFDPDRPDELIGKVRSLLADDSRRERIRRNGTAAVGRMPHTYDHRVARVVELYRAARG